jgi:hypothetical protein
MVDDEARQGALRFSEGSGEPFLRPDAAGRIPPVEKLGRAGLSPKSVRNDLQVVTMVKASAVDEDGNEVTAGGCRGNANSKCLIRCRLRPGIP